VPTKAKSLTLDLPRAVAEEIADAAAKSHRSPLFIVARALAAAKNPPPQPLDGERVPLALVADDDDPPAAVAAVKKASAATVATAWLATRERFAAWLARELQARRAEDADDLDAGLRDAAAAATLPARLVELAKSDYVKVRALVARHPSAPTEALALLGADKDRVVRAALAARG
jgi:leucine rich repeat (LRR) protein